MSLWRRVLHTLLVTGVTSLNGLLVVVCCYRAYLVSIKLQVI